MTDLARYDRMCLAIAECARVDEAKDIRDKAIALQAFARQAKNYEAERTAAVIRMRAERRCGELLKPLERSPLAGGGDAKSAFRRETPIPPSPYAAALSDTGLSRKQANDFQKRAEVPEEEFEAWLAVLERDTTAFYRTRGTANNEWFTPAEYLGLARAAMGDIDLDPASHAIAQETVRAHRFFTKVDNGLSQPWSGRIWLNPPYSKLLIGRFVDKLVAEVEAGRVTQAILLTHNSSDTLWFAAASRAARALCLPSGRIGFIDTLRERAAPTQGQAFHYFGPEAGRFAQVFGVLGRVWT